MNRVVIKSLLSQFAHNRFFGVALIFIGGGALAGVGSIISLVRFFRAHMPITQDFTASELLFGIIVPHMGLLFCVAMVGYGVFLLRRIDVVSFLVVAGRRPHHDG